ncbi:LytR/AlgR family response regulator transcription factor [Paraclostridium sordellii]|uniref:LytR/AlgR family response regulator transcription factor n=1 Tax=Paraclostridium sordellii TaxID=1505 RepID=UPI0005DD5A9C|nr:LytTR family DNA-binding domain-containing protein [Paeniclostridium sordellii]CEN26374.1 two-component signal transduction response regulator [[Clostridium] sordellii] [Paeniclostridium sordellii]
MPLSISICEDEKFYRDILKEYIHSILKSEYIEYELSIYSSGTEFFNNIDKKVDILLLDICLINESGMDIARKLRDINIKTEIIFITSMQNYVYEAYEVKAFRYMLKPIEYDLLSKYLKDCISEILNKNNMIVIKSNKNTLVLPINNILYIEVVRKIVTIYVLDGQHKIEISLKKLEKQLLNYSFFRCHNSYLVNLKAISGIKGNFIIINDYEVPVSRSKYKELQTKLAFTLGDILYK